MTLVDEIISKVSETRKKIIYGGWNMWTFVGRARAQFGRDKAKAKSKPSVHPLLKRNEFLTQILLMITKGSINMRRLRMFIAPH
jgi:uncharacterized protein YdaL